MDWFLYDNGLRHERVKSIPTGIYLFKVNHVRNLLKDNKTPEMK